MNEQEFRKGTPRAQVHSDADLPENGPLETFDVAAELKQALKQADVEVSVRDGELSALRQLTIALYEVLTDQEFPTEQRTVMTTQEILQQMVDGGRTLLNNARDTTNHATADAMRSSRAMLDMRHRSRRAVRALAEVVLAVTEEPEPGAPG